MPANEELVAFSLYLVLTGLAVPMLSGLNDGYPIASLLLLAVVVAPLPVWIAAIRYDIPERLLALLTWHLTGLAACVLLALAGFATLAVCRWLTA